MNYYLAKSEPNEYSIDDLEREGETIWDGIHNYQAINFIKGMKLGDLVYIYHSQVGKAIVGLAEVSSEPFENTADPRFSWAIKLKFKRKFTHQVTLAEMKAAPEFAECLITRNPRLSVMPVPPKAQKWLESQLS